MQPDSFLDRVEAGLASKPERKPQYALDKDKLRIKFDPEGDGYDYYTAIAHGLEPDKTGHWPSRSPKDGRILKGRRHETWHMTEQGENKEGFTIFKDPESGLYFSKKKE